VLYGHAFGYICIEKLDLVIFVTSIATAYYSWITLHFNMILIAIVSTVTDAWLLTSCIIWYIRFVGFLLVLMLIKVNIKIHSVWIA
jgi:hypothetical protein